jgi:hypothetical protein
MTKISGRVAIGRAHQRCSWLSSSASKIKLIAGESDTASPFKEHRAAA